MFSVMLSEIVGRFSAFIMIYHPIIHIHKIKEIKLKSQTCRECPRVRLSRGERLPAVRKPHTRHHPVERPTPEAAVRRNLLQQVHGIYKIYRGFFS